MEILSSLSAITSPIILTIIIVGVIAMYRTGTLQYLLSKNGNGGKEMNGSKEIIELKEQIAAIQNNHLHTLSEKLDDVKEAIERNTEAVTHSAEKTQDTFNEHFKIELKSQSLLENIDKKLYERRN